MQYIYLLTNVHVPKLVKFGFSRRDPGLRASELSAGTGVPGKWEVYHFWEVEDGYGVEQEVFLHLANKRLGRKEFLELEPKEAIARISAVIDDIGINPTARAKEEAERVKIERTRIAAERFAARNAVRAIHGEIHDLVRPTKELLARRGKFAGGIFTLVAFVLGVSIGHAAGANPLFAGLVVVGGGWLIPIPLLIEFVLKRGTPNNKDVERLYGEARRRVLAKHKLTEDTFRELNDEGEKWIWGNKPDAEIEMLTNPDWMIEDTWFEDMDNAIPDSKGRESLRTTPDGPKPRPQ